MDLAALPGFRRRFVVTPLAQSVTAAVEDDYHCMAVTLRHDGSAITGIESMMDRAPWTTCPGAPAVLKSTFEGALLVEASALGLKQANCTHLYDLAAIAAAHARDPEPLRYDILVCDPVLGDVIAEIRRDDVPVLRIHHRDNVMTAPPVIAGLPLFKLRGWIESLTGAEQDAARLLQWGTILAHGRITPMERQSDASRMPSNCYTFQPERKLEARRVGQVLDFSETKLELLEHFGADEFRSRSPG